MFSAGQTGPRLGIVEGETIVPLEGVASLEALLALEPGQRSAANGRRGAPVPLAQATLHAPVRPRKNVFAVGRNYLAHAEEGARARGEVLKLPDVPTMFSKAPTAIVGPNHTLQLQAHVSRNWDWEAELAVIIGRTCKDVEESRALDVVFGYTCLNDVTARDKQRATTQWFMGKTLDETCPIGPWVITADELGDPQTLDVSLLVNGETKQHANTSAMIFSVARVISYISQGMTLEAGDVIATGTPEGVGFARNPPEFLKDGDVMEVVISKVGTLRNPVSIK
jgi:2-keto-4-pentenoate hydratase/2-oxohepta-3-ene-1,7-dioic acid hydratase in catechol pathway